MKLYAVNVKGLLENELTKNDSYYSIRSVGDKFRLVNNYGYEAWYDKTRLETLNPNADPYDDADVKIYE